MVVVFICLAGGAGLGAAYFKEHAAPLVPLATGEYLSPRRELPDFSLIDAHGQPFGRSQLRGHWTLMFFGYTHCPDFCPTTLSTLAALTKRLRADAAPVLPQVLFMSVDAKRDTPEALARYVPYFDPSFIAVTAADQPAIETVAAKLGVAVMITPTGDGNYSVDHSGAILVLDPTGRLAAILDGPFTVTALRADFLRIVAARA
jgi:protein SCO1/2